MKQRRSRNVPSTDGIVQSLAAAGPEPPREDRRRFLKQSFLVAGSAVATFAPLGVGRAAVPEKNMPPNIPGWMQTQGQPVNKHPYGVPSPFEKGVVRELTADTPTNLSSWGFTPLQDLQGTITPNGLVYERDHAGVPAIDPREHRLMIHGMVENPRVFSMEDLKRFSAVSRIHFLECSGNTYMEWKAPTGKSVQETHGLVSCCEWTGVPVSLILNELGLKSGAKWVLAEGADAAALDRSVPLWKMMDDALLVYAQNGEMLRPEQGYPLRLLLPGFEGNMNVKWLRRLEVGDSPWMSREETSKYTDLMPDGKARMFTFMMEAKSVITFPSAGQHLSAHGPYEIRGVAWSGRGRVKRVDVSVDGGRNWTTAKLDVPILPVSFTHFRLPWRWGGQPAILQSRVMDETGYVQPTLAQLVAVRGLYSSYHNNAIQSWRIGSDGVISNVHV